ncbi:hypothetical protein ACA910_010322 [Epithemia clementina (nom. ined.)]
MTTNNLKTSILVNLWILADLRRTSYAVQTSKLQVQLPPSLRKEGGYDHRDAMFGIPPYGGSIQQQVYYSATTLCDANVDKKGGYPTRDDHSAWKTPFILMVDRGECSFVQKVRNAQRAGATGVLIADDVCICNRSDCQVADEEKCEQEEPTMSDDGSGSDISIPSFLVFKEDADQLKAALLNNQHVRVEMSFKVPSPDSHVEYELWTTASEPTSREIEKSFGVAAAALKDHAFFTPHMYIYDGIKAGCLEEGLNECYNLCTNNGRYCSNDPDDDMDYGASGADVVKECLRRTCIWNQYGLKDGVGKPWWNYVTEFIDRCDSPDPDYDSSKPTRYNDPECAGEAMTAAGIDIPSVEKCMQDAGGVEANTTNIILEAEIKAQESSGVVLVPSLVVNQAVIRGSLSFATVFKAICSGFVKGSEPHICKECSNCENEFACVRDGFCHGSSFLMMEGVSIEVFAIVLLGTSVLFCCIACIQHRRQQQYMRNQIHGIVAEYMPVSSQKNSEGTSLALPADDDDDENHIESFTIS